MAWNKSGEERVKSYRVYRELERVHHDTLEELARAKEALRAKDELIRRLAAELAASPPSEEHPMPITVPPTASRTLRVPGNGNKTVEETESGSIRGVRPGSYAITGADDAVPADDLSLIPSPKRFGRK